MDGSPGRKSLLLFYGVLSPGGIEWHAGSICCGLAVKELHGIRVHSRSHDGEGRRLGRKAGSPATRYEETVSRLAGLERPDGKAVARSPRREPVAGDTQMKEPGTGSRQTELILREALLAYEEANAFGADGYPSVSVAGSAEQPGVRR